jgi:hypothetical protein
MIEYISEHQLSIEEFKTPFQTSLLPDNRWVKLSNVVPWDDFASSYMSMMNTDFGRPGISPRIVLYLLCNESYTLRKISFFIFYFLGNN